MTRQMDRHKLRVQCDYDQVFFFNKKTPRQKGYRVSTEMVVAQLTSRIGGPSRNLVRPIEHLGKKKSVPDAQE